MPAAELGIDTLVEDKGDVGPFGQGDDEFPEEKVNGQGCCRDETDLWPSIRRGRAHSDSTFVAYSSATTSCEMRERMTIRPSSLRSLISRNVWCACCPSPVRRWTRQARTPRHGGECVIERAGKNQTLLLPTAQHVSVRTDIGIQPADQTRYVLRKPHIGDA